ncbi:flagellar FlbD family protein [Thermaerobacter sp. PB12/4term]|uniref:flagellar FlbD family protein n=1 Tax=Thermaerobacter sp. PB12/4term TaxID=2293838 RepID=UPI000E3299D0|nr:flagellar FlbD family protein [Thermaerobacter sp. PB12/4term]QIA26940.1 flagellar FlbD family protein [Thermaerobacter sp. PB12/4term]
MVPVTRLDGREVVVNAELIETLEATPDTVITLTTGRRLVVREPVERVIERVVAYRRRILAPAGGPGGAGASCAPASPAPAAGSTGHEDGDPR